MPSDETTTPRTGGLPPPPRAQGAYRTAIASENLVMTAGMTARVDGVLRHAGRIGENVTVAEGSEAAAIAASNAVAAIVDLLGPEERVGPALRMIVYVNAGAGFTEHSQVADGASQRLLALLGEERGVVVRSAVGVASLPGGACVEVELTCQR